MHVVRLCKRAHVALDGEGAFLNSGRWHSEGHRVVYVSSCSALAILEARVHLSTFPKNMLLILIDVVDSLKIERVTYIPNGLTEMRQIGDEWIHHGSTAVLEVPSVIAPRQKNYLLNPLHPDFTGGVAVLEQNPFAFDTRLLSATSAP
jgi:RES domain-containing protein